MAKQRIKSRPGLLGTIYYHNENGKPIGKSRPGLFEGTRVFTDQNGRYAGKSRPGFFVKEVFTDADYNHTTSYDSLCGDVHFKNGIPIGHTRPGFFNSAYTTLEPEDDLLEEDYYDEDFPEDDWAEDQAGYEDTADEAEFIDYEEYSPKVSQYTVVKNLQLLVLCLVICVVIASIYAIIHLN